MRNKSLKKLLMFALVLAMTAALATFTAVAAGDSVEIWLDADGGNDSNTGRSKGEAVRTIDKAFALAEVSAGIKKVIIVGDYNLTKDLPSHSDMITIMGDGTGKSNIVRSTSFSTNGPTAFENINFRFTKDYCFLNTGAHKIVFGENVTFTNSGTGYTGISAHIGTIDESNHNMLVAELDSGISAFVGPYYNSETRTTAGAKITINGGDSSFNLAADGFSGKTFYGTVYTDTVSFVLNGGSFTVGIATTYPTVFETDVQFVANNGLKLPEEPYFVFEEGYGFYKLECEAESGCKLDTTDIAGKFAVLGGKTALAVEKNTGKRFVSANGYLTVDAGEYIVTFDDDVVYTNNGEVIEFYKDFDLDITTVAHSEKAGRLFIGWTYEDGSAPSGTSFEKSEKLYAQYIDFDPDKDFYVEGAQIRLKHPLTNIGEGLRFVIRRTDATDVLDIKSYGSVIVPSLAAGKEDVELGKSYTYNGKKYAAKKVPAANILAKYDDFERYTVCVTKINDQRYATLFSVRGYIEYVDLNGCEQVIYTDYYATNLVNVAKMVVQDKYVSDKNAKARCEALIGTEKQRVRDKYNNLPKLALSNNYPSGATAVSLDKIYQLGNGGVSVRDVVIDTGKGGEAVEIFQISDLHFNYLNAADFEEAHPSVLASYNGRQWLKDAASVPNAITALEYASQGDAVVITGDVLDYLTLGSIELMHKYIWDPYPDTIITLGNHEFSRRCQDNPQTPDPTSAESRYELLQENWDNDIYYSSTVLKDKVMLIQLDNGDIKFWERQIEPLKRDLALARKEGYAVLLFYHIPLCTYNPEETNVYPIRRNDQFNHDFSSKNVGNPETTDAATLAVYDIITNNADIIKAGFCGHAHSDYYTEIIAKNADGTSAVIPQWVLTGNPFDGGHALKITVK